MEFLIGREVTGSNVIKVPNQYSSVSRIHAKVTIDEKKIVLEDLNSSNGTYVNGRGVVSTTININDKITLGKETEYVVNLNEIIDNYNKFKNENKTDYSSEFDELKKIYDEYIFKKEGIIKKQGFKSFLPKAIITIFLALILGFIVPQNYKFVISSIVIAIGGSLTFLPNKNKKTDELLDILENNYFTKYVCPKCSVPLGLDNLKKNSWTKLKHNKSCPHKCGAIYSK